MRQHVTVLRGVVRRGGLGWGGWGLGGAGQGGAGPGLVLPLPGLAWPGGHDVARSFMVLHGMVQCGVVWRSVV